MIDKVDNCYIWCQPFNSRVCGFICARDFSMAQLIKTLSFEEA